MYSDKTLCRKILIRISIKLRLLTQRFIYNKHAETRLIYAQKNGYCRTYNCSCFIFFRDKIKYFLENISS